jgi:hypothetical protein
MNYHSSYFVRLSDKGYSKEEVSDPYYTDKHSSIQNYSNTFSNTMQMQPTPRSYSILWINAFNASKPRKYQHRTLYSDRTPPNGVLSRKSATNSSTLFRYRPNNACFSSVLRTVSLSLSALFLFPVSTRLNAPASLLGLRCSIAGTDTVGLAEGIEGVSGMR